MTLRILDANFNRAAEGLRVVEDYLRFVLNHQQLAERYKRVRHLLSDQRKPLAAELVRSRDAGHDVGATIDTPQELSRTDPPHVAQASQARVEQALRCLEEYGKLVEPPLMRMASLRYEIYELGQAWQRIAETAQRLNGKQLYVLLDARENTTTFENIARAIVDGGADLIQLRDKHLSDREMLRRGEILRDCCGDHCLFVINDRPDLAVLCGADGVHVGQDELPVEKARQIIQPHQLIGVSTHCLADLQRALAEGADYVGCGPVFSSRTKSFEHYAGLDFLRAAATESTLPAFAIGGIDEENLEEVLATGIHRIAVSHAVVAAEKPEEVTRRLKQRLTEVDGTR